MVILPIELFFLQARMMGSTINSGIIKLVSETSNIINIGVLWTTNLSGRSHISICHVVSKQQKTLMKLATGIPIFLQKLCNCVPVRFCLDQALQHPWLVYFRISIEQMASPGISQKMASPLGPRLSVSKIINPSWCLGGQTHRSCSNHPTSDPKEIKEIPSHS